MIQCDGWNYDDPVDEGLDGRKLCTLYSDGMTWVGIRHFAGGRWLNNGEPLRSESVIAWRELPQPAKGYWDRGRLHIPKETAHARR